MQVTVTFEFTDEERERITVYYRKRDGVKGLPRLATRVLLRQFIESALTNQWLSVGDELDIR